MNDRLFVDPAGLHQGGVNIEQYSALVNRINNQLLDATIRYRNSGGTGEMGEKFQENYKPGELKALQFLALLAEIIGQAGTRTLHVARHFEQVDGDAGSSIPRE